MNPHPSSLTSLPKPRILLVHPHLAVIGGAELVAIWMVEALKDDYEVTVSSWVPMDVERFNHFYSTALHESDFTERRPPRILQWVVRAVTALGLDPDGFQQYAVFLRFVKSIQRDYDLVIGAYQEADFGTPGIQYIHFPWLSTLYPPHVDYQQASLGRRLKAGLSYVWRPWRLISGFSFDQMHHNLTLVNSNWTGRVYEQTYGTPVRTLYPPVPGKFPKVSWEKKELGFVAVGRLCPEKGWDQMLRILSLVREKGHDIHFHIVGKTQAVNQSFHLQLRQKVKVMDSWVTLHENLSRKELLELVARQRFGLHVLPDEPFGIAVAEMVRAGCIVFAPGNAGPMEILGGDERLLFRDDEEAVEKILSVLNSPQSMASIRISLEKQREVFGTDRFVRETRQIVAEFLKGQQR